MAKLSSFDPCYKSDSYPADPVVGAPATDVCINTHNHEQLMPSSVILMLFIQFSIAFVNLRNTTTKQQTTKQDHCPFSSSTRAFPVICIARTYQTLLAGTKIRLSNSTTRKKGNIGLSAISIPDLSFPDRPHLYSTIFHSLPLLACLKHARQTRPLGFLSPTRVDTVSTKFCYLLYH